MFVQTLGGQTFNTVTSYLYCFLLAALLARLLWNKFCTGLYNIPGPRLASYTKIWRLVVVWKGRSERVAIDLHQKYGPLVRMAPKVVSVADPSAIPILYGLKTGYNKSAFYPPQSISLNGKTEENLFSTADNQYHREQKRLIAHAFSMTTLLEAEEMVDSCTRLFMSRLGELSAKPVDLGDWMQYYAFDVVGELTFGKKLGFLEQGSDVDDILHGIEGFLKYSSRCGQVPEMHPLLLGNPLLHLCMPNMENMDSILKFTLKALKSRTSVTTAEPEVSKTNGKDMLSRWLAAKLNDRDIIVHTSVNVGAGSDTTAIALRAIIYLLLRNPDKSKKLLDQIDQADREGKLSDPVSYKEVITNIPYMDPVMKEAMRLHPSVGLMLERIVPPGGVQLAGRYIPTGTIVGMNAWVLHHDASVYPDPEAFIPERWIENSPERLKQMEQSFFVFGSGSRTCIGKNISLMEMTKLIPQMLREFTIELTHPEREWKTKNIWFVQQEGLICNLKRRTK